MSDHRIEVKISSSRHIFVDADADSFGQMFASMSNEEQVAVFRSMVEHMRPHKTQWDYIAIELEKEENREVRSDMSVIFPEVHKLVEANGSLSEALQECEEYFDNRADADHDETGFVPNKEMQLLSTVRAALAQAGA